MKEHVFRIFFNFIIKFKINSKTLFIFILLLLLLLFLLKKKKKKK